MRQLKQNPPPKGVKRGKVILRSSQRMNVSKHTQMKGSLELCYVAIQPCSLDSLIFACTLITVCKKGIFGKQNG